MKFLFFACTGLLLIAVLMTGCTGKPAAVTATATPAATSAAVLQPECIPVIPPATLTSTTWNLVWFDDTKGVWSKVAEGSKVTATFFNEGKVTGSGGCHGYTTDFQLGNESRIWIRRPAVPESICQSPFGVMDQESAYFTDLERAENYTVTNDQLLVFNSANRRILQFDAS